MCFAALRWMRPVLHWSPAILRYSILALQSSLEDSRAYNEGHAPATQVAHAKQHPYRRRRLRWVTGTVPFVPAESGNSSDRQSGHASAQP